MWDLGLVLFDSCKNVVKLGPKWTKTIIFGYVSRFHLDCLCLMKDYLWSKFSKLEPYLGETGPRNPSKRAISWMLHCHENI